MRHAWSVVLEPEEASAETKRGLNRSGLLILLTDGEAKREVCRVAFVRRNSRNPDVSFEDQLAADLERAQRACDVLNDYLDALERERAEALMKCRDQVDEILGPRSTVPA